MEQRGNVVPKPPRNKLGYLIQHIGVTTTGAPEVKVPIRMLTDGELRSIEKHRIRTISKSTRV